MERMVGRKCSICFHSDVDKINTLIAEGKSFRDIAGQFELSKSSVSRHAEDCLDVEVARLIKEQKIEKAIDYYQKRAEYVVRSERLLRACDEWLSDPNDSGRINLSPRSDELTVIYLDHNDLFMGQPQRKKAVLSHLLEDLFQQKGVQSVRVINSQMDNRKLFLDTMKDLNTKLDAIAKTEGLYQKEQEHADDKQLNYIKQMVQQKADEKGISFEKELKNYLEHYAAPEFKEKLANELVN